MSALRPDAPTVPALAPDTDAPLVVLQSFPEPRTTTNPYLVMLRESLERTPGVTVVPFSWRAALRGRYDVFHAHWPEILVDGRTPLRKLVRQALALVFLVRLRMTRTPIVRTVHNLGLPQGISRRERLLLRLFDRWTTLRVALNTSTPLAGRLTAVIPHGDYRSWFEPYPRSAVVPGRIAYVGLIRRYKGVEQLVDAFVASGTAHPEMTLTIGGKPSTPELEDELRRRAATDPRITLELGFLSDARLVAAVTAAELVVLPYRFMHNSGTVLAALSLGRPVLVPDNDVNRRLAEEVGPGWVHLFTGDLTVEELLSCMAALRTGGRSGKPDLSRRGWTGTGHEHLAAYRRAIAEVAQ